jgi:hypothetical protein
LAIVISHLLFLVSDQVQHAVPAAGVVHDDGSCFEKEGSHKDAAVAAARDNMMTSTAEQQAVGNKGVDSKKEEAPKEGHEEGSKQEGDGELHKEEAMADDDSDDCVLEDVAQDVEAKLGIVVVNPAPAAIAAEAKPGVVDEEERRRGGRGVTTKKAKAVVVPVDDDEYDDLDGEAAEPEPEAVAPSSDEAPGREESKGEETSEEGKKAEEE